MVPIINEKLCTNCGVCLKNCIANVEIETDNFDSLFYESFSKDDENVLEASSGGIFGEIAKYIINKKGVVYGALSKEFYCITTKVSCLQDISVLKGSKYQQSNCSEV